MGVCHTHFLVCNKWSFLGWGENKISHLQWGIEVPELQKMYSTFNNACGIIYLEVKNSSSKLFYQVSTFTYGLRQAETQRLLHREQNYPGTELSKNSVDRTFKRKASIKLHLSCMRRIWDLELVFLTWPRWSDCRNSRKSFTVLKKEFCWNMCSWMTDNTSLMMNSWVDHGNDCDKLLKLTWWHLTLWPMMLLSTISITHCDRSQISIQRREWTSHLFCFYLHSLTRIWAH